MNHWLTNLTVLIVSRTSLITADFIVICTTWLTLSRRGDASLDFGRDSFRTVLLRDGMYVSLIAVAH